MISPEARERLAGLMDDRRLELGLRWRDVAEAGGVSYEVLRDVRNGTGGIRRLTERAIEVGLQWEPGSVQAILDGGELEPRPFTPVRDVLPEPTAEMEKAIAGFVADVEAKANDARRAHPGTRLTGLMVFPRGPALAQRMWDGLAAKGWPEEEIPAGVAYALTIDVQEALADARQGNAAGLTASGSHCGNNLRIPGQEALSGVR